MFIGRLTIVLDVRPVGFYAAGLWLAGMDMDLVVCACGVEEAVLDALVLRRSSSSLSGGWV